MYVLLPVLVACTPPLADTDDTEKNPASDSGSPGRDTNEPEPDPTAMEHNLASAAGDYAVDLLANAPYDSLVVELDWVAGYAPEQASLDALEAALDALVNKPGGVELVLDDEIPPQGAPEWTYGAAEDMEVAWRDRYRDAESGQAVIYYLYVDGHSEYDTDTGRVLGYAYHGSSLIMFAETIADAESGLPLAATVGEVVAVHELGHLLGLVNNGVEMVDDHQDTAHGNHDDNRDCIMYWAVETDAVVDMLLTGAPDFDDACRADMAAAGGKPAR